MLAGFDWEKFKQTLLEEHPNELKTAISPAIESIVNSIEAIYDMYVKCPDDFVNDLTKVMEDSTIPEYVKKEITPMRKKFEEDEKKFSAYAQIIPALGTLKRCMSDREFIWKTFHTEIKMVNNDKNKYFNLVDAVCRKAIKSILEVSNPSHAKNSSPNL